MTIHKQIIPWKKRLRRLLVGGTMEFNVGRDYGRHYNAEYKEELEEEIRRMGAEQKKEFSFKLTAKDGFYMIVERIA